MLDTGSRTLINSIKSASPKPSKIFVATLVPCLAGMSVKSVSWPVIGRLNCFLLSHWLKLTVCSSLPSVTKQSVHCIVAIFKTLHIFLHKAQATFIRYPRLIYWSFHYSLVSWIYQIRDHEVVNNAAPLIWSLIYVSVATNIWIIQIIEPE